MVEDHDDGVVVSFNDDNEMMIFYCCLGHKATF
jgi:hypothetical protein